jgi:hypothetical protein
MSGNDSPDGPEARSRPDRHRTYGPAAVAVVTIALTAWPIAFNLGAYDAVFYQDVFQIVVVSTVAFAIVLVRSPYDGLALWFTRIALAAPAVWLTGVVLLFDSLGEAVDNLVYGLLGLVIAVVSIPTVLRVLVELFTPEVELLENRRVLALTVGIVAFVAIAGFAIGRNNDAFLTCDDFKIAGSDQPTNCAAE